MPTCEAGGEIILESSLHNSRHSFFCQMSKAKLLALAKVFEKVVSKENT